MILMSALKPVKLYDTLSLPDASEDVVSEAILRLKISMLYFFILMCKNYKKKVEMFNEKYANLHSVQ